MKILIKSEYWLTYSMEKSPSWEANRFSASQETPRILWNPKVQNRIHKCPLPVPILSQLEPAHTPSHSLKINLNIILPPMPGSSKWSPSIKFPIQNPVDASPIPHTHYLSHPPHSSRFYHILSHNILTDKQNQSSIYA